MANRELSFRSTANAHGDGGSRCHNGKTSRIKAEQWKQRPTCLHGQMTASERLVRLGIR